LAASLLLALALSEVTVRVLDIDGPAGDMGIAPHPLWHHWHRTNYEFHYQVAHEDITQLIHFNEFGMRDSRSATVGKPAGVVRVAILGDSFVEALQVPERDGVCRRLEHLLSDAEWPECERRGSIEVLNFGCSGFSSITEYYLLSNFVGQFCPDFVLCFHHFSDMTEDWQLPAHSAWGSAPHAGWNSLLRRSRLYRLASGLVSRRRQRRLPHAEASLRTSFDAVLHDPETSEDLDAWRHSLEFVGYMADWCREQQKPFLLAVIPLGSQVEPPPAGFAARAGYRYLTGGQRLENDNYQRHVVGYCQEQGIACIDLLPAFRAANPRGQALLYLPRDQHWTAAGHALAARTVASYILLNGKSEIAQTCDGTGTHRRR
jgi:hypothetical protein